MPKKPSPDPKPPLLFDRKIWIPVAIVAGLISLIILLTSFHPQEILTTFSHARAWMVLLYLAAVIVMMFVFTWRWQVILASQGHDVKIPFRRLFWYRVASYGVNYVTPTAKIGGEAIRASLATKHGIKYRDAFSTVIIDKTIEVGSSGAFFVIGAMVLLAEYALPPKLKWLLILISVLILALVVLFYHRMLRGKDVFLRVFRFFNLHKSKNGKAWEQKLTEFEDLIIAFHHRDRWHFGAAMMLSLVGWALMYLEFYMLLAILGNPGATPLEVFLIFSLVGAAFLIPIPMALGSLEASQIWAFSLIGLSQAAGLGLALVTRTRDTFWAVLAFIVLPIYGLRWGSSVREAKSLGDDVGLLKTLKK